MAHFYASIQGGKGAATRCGTKGSGLSATIASWQGAVKVLLWYNESEDEDWVNVWLDDWKGVGADPPVQLYNGPISGIPERIARRMEK